MSKKIDKPLCWAPSCDRQQERWTGLCEMHHKRFMRNGVTERLFPLQAEHCSIKGCFQPVCNRNMCSAHYTNWLRYKNPLHKRTMRLETRKKISKTLKKRKPDRETLLSLLSRGKETPNKLEKSLISLIEKYNLPYKYVGDGSVLLFGRCPDFINVDGNKTVVELFGRWWHDPSRNSKVNLKYTQKETINHYLKYGFKCIIIWEEELKNEETLVKKLSGVL